MLMKKFIIISTILIILEIIFLAICYVFFISRFFFEDYMDELYLHFGLDMYSEEYCGCDIIKEFETLFGKYQNHEYLYDIMMISFPFPLAVYIFLLSFMIIYLCHLKRKSCCKCKKNYSYYFYNICNVSFCF